MKTDSNVKKIITTEIPSVNEHSRHSSTVKNVNSALPDVSYFFSNDTLCQILSITEKSKNKQFNIPGKLDFKLVLHDQQHRYDNKIYEGVAKLASSEESFSDNSEQDGGAYDAVDYNFVTLDYKVQIRLDIQNYDACVVSITTNHPEGVLGGYRNYLKKFPNEGVMKRGEFK